MPEVMEGLEITPVDETGQNGTETAEVSTQDEQDLLTFARAHVYLAPQEIQSELTRVFTGENDKPLYSWKSRAAGLKRIYAHTKNLTAAQEDLVAQVMGYPGRMQPENRAKSAVRAMLKDISEEKLQEACAKRGVDTSGPRWQVVERLIEAIVAL